jgi:hypothetical protein
MKKGNNNSPPPYLIEYWIKGLFKEGVTVKKKIIKTNKTISKNTKSKQTDDDDDDILIKIIKIFFYYNTFLL